MKLQFSTLDVFTTHPLEGNPLAIVHIPSTLPHPLPQSLKQKIAQEFNLSETVFLHEPSQTSHGKDVQIDIFTVAAEVPFAGHPTVGTTNYLLRYLARSEDEAVREKWQGVDALVAKAGRMKIELVESLAGDGWEGGQLEVAHNVRVHENRLSSERNVVDLKGCAVVSSVRGMSFILAKLENEQELAEKPRANLVGADAAYTSQDLLDPEWRTGLVASYFYVDLGVDEAGTRQLRTRMFGSREDPATGSAACALCSWLSLQGKDRRRRYRVVQGVEMGRRSEIGVEVWTKEGGEEIERVVLSGSAVKVLEGYIEIPVSQ